MVEFGTQFIDFGQSTEGISTHVVRGGEHEVIEARWLVRCDGGHSLVRKQAGIAFEGETRDDVRMIGADVKVDGLDRSAWEMWTHEEGSWNCARYLQPMSFRIRPVLRLARTLT